MEEDTQPNIAVIISIIIFVLVFIVVFFAYRQNQKTTTPKINTNVPTVEQDRLVTTPVVQTPAVDVPTLVPTEAPSPTRPIPTLAPTDSVPAQ